jgi:aryl-phospho-beta-D-glucosidase BglC (GH1 family)
MAAQKVGGLHTVPLTAYGEVGGVVQTAWWSLHWGKRREPLSLQYVATTYTTPNGAAAATNDARATLWENARPTAIHGLSDVAFTMQQRGLGQSVTAVTATGNVSWELQLHYPTSLPRAQLSTAIGALSRAAKGAGATASVVSPAAPLAAQAPAVALEPAGVGPVVKSASLMSLDALGSITALGSIRSATPPAAGLSQNHPTTAPNGAATRYACIGRSSTGIEIYNSTAIYSTTDVAAAHLTAMQTSEVNANMTPLAYSPAVTLPHLHAATVYQWSATGETILAFAVSNVLVVLATRNSGATALPPLAESIAASIPGWLSASGTQIVDWAGVPQQLDGVNWYGAESVDYVPGGMDVQPYTAILQSIVANGFNTVRIPFSNGMIEQNPVVTAHLGANPSLQGLHALDILDRIVQEAGALGLHVVLDDHRATPGWSSQPNGLWYDDTYSDAAFVADWSSLAHRYAGTNVVVGADLHNEPHATATWGDNNVTTDWRLAAERAGDAALASNAHLLIMVEGVQFAGNAQSYWWGGNLLNVATAPVELQYAGGASAKDRLVYSIHDYGPDTCGTGCPWFNPTTTYDSLAAIWEQYWGYILDNPTASYAAPVWVGEFGTCNGSVACVQSDVPGSQGQWFQSLVRYIATKHTSWTYWSINGTRSTGDNRVYGDPEGYGYLDPDWATPHLPLVQGLAPIKPSGAASPQSP